MSNTRLELSRIIMDAWDADHKAQRDLIEVWKGRAQRANEDRAELVQKVVDLRRKYEQPDMADR